MRRKHNYLAGLFLCLMLICTAVFAGCGKEKVTPSSILSDVGKNVEKLSSMSANMNMDISMAVEQDGVNVSVDLNGNFDMDITKEPDAVRMDGTLSMSMMGVSISMESYTVEEDGKAVTYTKAADQWSKTETDLGDTTQLDTMNGFFEGTADYTLQEKTEKSGDQEVYVLKTKISGDMMEDIMGSMADSMDGLSGSMDWSSFDADLTLKVNTKTMMPVEMIMDCGEGFSSLMESAGETEGASTTVDTFVITITYNSFDDVEEIVVPEEAKTAAQSSLDNGLGGFIEEETETDNSGLDSFLSGTEDETEPEETDVDTTEPDGPVANEDGTYTLTDFMGELGVNIATPQGYEVCPYSSSYLLYFTDTAGQDFDEANVTYFLSLDYTEEALVSEYLDDISYYEEDDSYTDVVIEDLKKVQTSRGEAGYIKVSYVFDETLNCVEYNAFLFLEDGSVVECMIEEDAYEEECSLLDEATLMETVFSVVQ